MITFRLAHHLVTGEPIVEVYRDDEFLATINSAADDAFTLISVTSHFVVDAMVATPPDQPGSAVAVLTNRRQ